MRGVYLVVVGDFDMEYFDIVLYRPANMQSLFSEWPRKLPRRKYIPWRVFPFVAFRYHARDHESTSAVDWCAWCLHVAPDYSMFMSPILKLLLHPRLMSQLGNVGDPEAVSVVATAAQGLYRQAEAQWVSKPSCNAARAGYHGHVKAWPIRRRGVPGAIGYAYLKLSNLLSSASILTFHDTSR